MARFRLQTVLVVAQEREDNARKALEKAIVVQREADTQKKMLEEYRNDYQNRLRSGIPISPFQWQGYQDFLIRLQQAIEIQANVCEQAQKKVEDERETYFKHQRFLKGIEILKEKHEKEELQRQDKAEQKLLDELAMRQRKPAEKKV